jgi:hypothetical protein
MPVSAASRPAAPGLSPVSRTGGTFGTVDDLAQALSTVRSADLDPAGPDGGRDAAAGDGPEVVVRGIRVDCDIDPLPL